MQNSFTPVNHSHADARNFTLGLRARPTQRTSYRDEVYVDSLDTPKDSDTPVRQGGRPWEEEEEKIFREACKKHNYEENRTEAGRKVVRELGNRGFRRNPGSCAGKWWRMNNDLEECERIFGMREGITWDSGAHRMRARDDKAQQVFIKNHPEYKRFFIERRKWMTAELAMRAPPAVVQENDDIYNATPLPPPSTRKRGRPRKLNQSKGKEPESTSLERPRKRTCEASPSASYQPTNRSSSTLSGPFPSISPSHSPLMGRHTPLIDPMDILQDLAKQGLQAQTAIPPNWGNEASGSQAFDAVQYPPRPTVEDDPLDDQGEVQQQPPASLPTNNAGRPPSSMPGYAPTSEQQQEEIQRPEREARSSAPRPRSLSMEKNASQRQQREQVPRPSHHSIPRVYQGPFEIFPPDRSTFQPQNPLQAGPSNAADLPQDGQSFPAPPAPRNPEITAARQGHEQNQEIKQEDQQDENRIEVDLTLLPESETSDNETLETNQDFAGFLLSQIEKDMAKLPNLSEDGRSAMYACLANEETGRLYVGMVKNKLPERYRLEYVTSRLKTYFEKEGKNKAALFKRARH